MRPGAAKTDTNQVKWYFDHLHQLKTSWKQVNSHRVLLLSLAIILILLVSFFSLVSVHASTFLVTYGATTPPFDLTNLQRVKVVYFVFQWLHNLISIAFLFVWAFFCYVLFIVVQFLFDLAYRLIAHPSEDVVRRHVQLNMSLRDALRTGYSRMLLFLIVPAGCFLGYQIWHGASLLRIIDLYSFVIIAAIPPIYSLTYFHIWKTYKRAGTRTRKRIAGYLFSQYSVHRALLSFLSFLVFLGLLGYFLLPAYLFSVSKSSLLFTEQIKRSTSYVLYWPIIRESQVAIGSASDALPAPDHMEPAFNNFHILTDQLGNYDLLRVLQNAFFRIVAILSVFVVGTKAALNIVLHARSQWLKKVGLATLYTTVLSALVSLVLKYLFFVDMNAWSLYALLFTFTLNALLVAQTTE